MAGVDDTSIHPLEPSLHPEELTNVATGRLSPNIVNVHLSVGKSQQQAIEFH